MLHTRTVVLSLAVGVALPFAVPSALQQSGGPGRSDCRASLTPDILRIRPGPSRVLADFRRPLREPPRISVPEASGLRVEEVHARRGDRTAVVGLRTRDARPGRWTLIFSVEAADAGRCTARLRIAR